MKIPKSTKKIVKFLRKVCETVYGIICDGESNENEWDQAYEEELGLWVRVHEALSNLAAYYEDRGYVVWKKDKKEKAA